jgi:hypothetical protein
MSIKKLLEKTIKIKTKDKEEPKYASSFRRSTAATIDIWLVLLLRVAFMQTLGTLWLNSEILKFIQEFNEKFGTESIKNTPEHIDFAERRWAQQTWCSGPRTRRATRANVP